MLISSSSQNPTTRITTTARRSRRRGNRRSSTWTWSQERRAAGTTPPSGNKRHLVEKERNPFSELIEIFLNLIFFPANFPSILDVRFVDPYTTGPSTDLKHNQCRNIAPVELNAYLCKAARILSEFYDILGKKSAEVGFGLEGSKGRIRSSTISWVRTHKMFVFGLEGFQGRISRLPVQPCWLYALIIPQQHSLLLRRYNPTENWLSSKCLT